MASERSGRPRAVVARSQATFEDDGARVGLAVGVAFMTPNHPAAAETSTSASDSKLRLTSSELLKPEHLEIGEVDIDQEWKRVALRQ